MTVCITTEQINRLAPGLSDDDAEHHAAGLSAALPAGDLSTPLRVAHFMAQYLTETWGLAKLRESMKYTHADHLLAMFPHEIHGLDDATALIAAGEHAIGNRVYADRYGNGNESSGDGWAYRGGGMGLTFRSNYRAIGQAIGMDLEGHPELLSDPVSAALASVKFWHWRNINAPADRDDIVAVTKLINPSLVGLTTRKGNLLLTKAIWK